MALTTSTLNGTITANQTLITLAAYTSPSGAGFIGQYPLLQFATGETCRITDASLSPTLSVVRGYAGTTAVAHTSLEGVQYALNSDTNWPAAPARQLGAPVLFDQTQEITITGSTGSTAATVTPASLGFLNATGTSGAGLNLPYPTVGMAYTVKNSTTGVCKIYCVGGTINTTTGTTAFSLTATGNLMAFATCSTVGVWQLAGNT